MLIYHIVLPEKWNSLVSSEHYAAESLETEGFIHCSYENQLPGVLKRYYSRVEKVVILTIETEKLKSKLVAETSTGGEVYPHLYGRLNHNAVVNVEERELQNSSDMLTDFA